MKRRQPPPKETSLQEFRVVESDGLPKAIFDGLDPVRNLMLSNLLHPFYTAARSLYHNTRRIAENEQLSWMYEDTCIKATCTKDGLLIESLLSAHQNDDLLIVKLSLADTEILLLKWTTECMKWEVKQMKPG